MAEDTAKLTRQSNIRTTAEDSDSFRAYCKENGITQTEAFSKMIHLLELEGEKKKAPGRADEIEEVERAARLIISKYTDSVRYANDTDSRVREDFREEVASKEKAISKAEETAKKAEARANAIEDSLHKSEKELAALRKQLFAEEKRRRDAEKVAEDKNYVIEMLRSNLESSQEIVGQYDKLREKVEEERKKHATALSKLQADHKEHINRLKEAYEKDGAAQIKKIHKLEEDLKRQQETSSEAIRKTEDAQKAEAESSRKAFAQTENSLKDRITALEKELLAADIILSRVYAANKDNRIINALMSEKDKGMSYTQISSIIARIINQA